MDSTDAVVSKSEVTFKIPALPKTGRTEKDTKTANDESKLSDTCENIVDETPSSSNSVPKSDNSTIISHTRGSLTIPYSEPSWGAIPDALYSFEIIKGGVSIGTVPLYERSHYVIGRLSENDIVLVHPSVSRFHAVLQFRSTFDKADPKKGFYIYDLGSTHGTFVNKMRVQSKQYVKVQVGHMLKFGTSTRSLLLHGPEDDKEEESQYSYTQLREMRQKQLEERERTYLEDQAKLLQPAETDGCNWGMGEDADEETDLTENPFATTNNEELYLNDPKKTLKGWFDREGEELVYDVEEKSFGQFHCKIDLPIENVKGGVVTAEVTVSGKKKEAVHQCALEACRILDRYGLLRQATHESKSKKKKTWEEDDFYASDEDNYFDRTGELEKKRQQRMKQSKKDEPPPVETYETLVEKHAQVVKQIEEIARKLDVMSRKACSSANNVKKDSEENDDSLESYMKEIKGLSSIDKLQQRKYQNDLANLKKEEDRLKKLVQFTKPLNLPELYSNSSSTSDNVQAVVQNTSIEEMDRKPENATTGSKRVADTDTVDAGFKWKKKKKMEEVQVKNIPEEAAVPVEPEPELEPELEPESELQPDEYSEVSDSDHEDSEDSSEVEEVPETKPQVVQRPDRPRLMPKTKSNFWAQYNDNEDFSNIVWTPPEGQTGDGRTSLNDKYGY